MRPLTGDDASGRSRTSDPDPLSTFRLPAAPQMTFTLGDESTVGPSSQGPTIPSRRAKEHGAVPHTEQHPEHSKPRIPSHLDFERTKEPATTTRPPASKGATLDTLRQEDYDLSRPVSPLPRSTDTPSLSQPLTPVFLGTSGPASALSSVSSRRNSLCLSEDLPSCPPSMRDGDVAVEDDDDNDNNNNNNNNNNGNGDQEGMNAEKQQQQQHGGGSADEGGISNIQGNDDDAGGGDTSCEISPSMVDSGSAPQLIMPSIKMPSRRPFTDDGKRMGRLKVLIAGDSGVGKTSLIKAIVQSCEHIVHVDPINPSPSSSSVVMGRSSLTGAAGGVGSARQKAGSRRQSARESAQGTTQITEIYASTKPYPEWWSEVDDLRVLRRRKSLGDSVLDRNICFVDTPGYGSGSSSMDTITPVSQYIEAHLQRISSNSLSDGDLLNLLGGEGGVQVDAVFYLVSNRLRPVDIEYLRQLSPFTNIIILLAQADLMSADQIAASKAQIHGQLEEADIRLFSFSLPSSPTDADKQGVYAVSSATGSDHDTMDASLLMSPDYVQPLAPSELCTLVADVFSPGGVARLRHAVARKYVQWRASSGQSRTSSLFSTPSLSRHHQASPLSLSLSLQRTSEAGASNSYALARLADHAQREERLAQVRLANWAADLQRSLAREREEYASLARKERALWLAERMGECVRDGDLGSLVVSERSRSRLGVAADADRDEEGRTRAPRRQRRGRAGQGDAKEDYCHHSSHHHCHHHHHQQQQQQKRQQQSQRHKQDPLGLLEVADELRHKGLVALELLGGIGVLGGLALWVTKNYLHLQPYGWLAAEWERFWYGPR
ncbi:Septin-domain-containing protein [Thermothelomyces heterothallicus CBS 202.75]|uniref:Septin-domain-containing protein n=1 Tax=Thermothelomyces heterothallicus CBS 202.75 TaxID=1149848 RepID=UPI0037432126